MFSNITDAWGNDPVKEITNKLSKGAFQSHTDHEKVFNFKKQNLLQNQKKVNDIVSLSENMSLSLASENTDASKNSLFSDVTEYTTYAPANYDKYPNKKHKILRGSKHPSINSINFTDTDTDTSNILDTVEDSKCTYSTKHLKKCDRCYYKLKKLVDNKINKKIDDIVLDTKMKQLEAFSQNQQQTSLQKNSGTSDSWKETLIIVVGAIIAILIILLIFKCMH